MRYAVPEVVYGLLSIDPLTAPPETLDEVEGVEEAIAALIDLECNRTFGALPVAKTRTLTNTRNGYTWYTDRIILDSGLVFFGDFKWGEDYPFVSPYGMRNVTSIVSGGTWNGLTWDDEDVHSAEEWELVFLSQKGWYYGIDLPLTATTIRVTAEWEDDSQSTTVPPEIREAANFLTADEYRVRHQSPAGEIGPPGLATYLRNPWEFTSVKIALNKNKFRQIVA